MDDLVRWLGEQLDTDTAKARAAADGGSGRWTQTDPEHEPGRIETDRLDPVTYDEGHPDEAEAAHIAEWDPARVLREIDAKRQVLDRYTKAVQVLSRYSEIEESHVAAREVVTLGWVLKAMTLPYADRSGYREEWRP